MIIPGLMKIFPPIYVFLIMSAYRLPAAEPATALPSDFLRTDSKRLQEVLTKPITADFREATLRNVIDSIAKQTQVNFVVKLGAGAGLGANKPTIPGTQVEEKEPVFSGRFARTPLRAVLYQISRETHLAVDWFYLPENPGTPQAISIHSKADSK